MGGAARPGSSHDRTRRDGDIVNGARLRLAVVGTGQMGSQHARVIGGSDLVDLAWVVDADPARAETVSRSYGGTPTADLDAALTACDAVVLAAPTELHRRLADQVLEAGLPLLIEKPVAESVTDVIDIVETASKADVPLLCGFVERHNPAVTTAMRLLDGPVRHAVAIRHSPPAPRIRTSVVWDLLVHDLDLAVRLAGGGVETVGAGAVHVGSSLEVADALVRSETGGMFTLSSSRVSQRKIRSWTIATDTAMVEIDLVRQDVTSYRHVTHLAGEDVGYRAETVVDIPFVRHGGEPLELQLQHFVSLVEGRSDAAVERESILRAHELASEVEQRFTT